METTARGKKILTRKVRRQARISQQLRLNFVMKAGCSLENHKIGRKSEERSSPKVNPQSSKATITLGERGREIN